MSKRLTDVTKWTKNKWFRKLKPNHKLFWLYLLDNCDNVGVWEEDIELASILISYEYNKDEILKEFKDKVKVFRDGKKWWVKDFIVFQYGELKEEHLTNKPHQCYIRNLKKHRLWIDYTKTIHSLKEKEKDKDKDIEEENDKMSSKEILQLWNDLAEKKDLPVIQKITQSRRDKFNTRLKESSFDYKKILSIIESSDFLCGDNNRNWKVALDWILTNDTNYVKILEGKYDNGKISKKSNTIKMNLGA